MGLIKRALLNDTLDSIESFQTDWIEATLFSKVSPHEKEINEDSCLVLLNDEFALCAVADGLGGHKGGGTASKIVIEEILSHFEKNIPKGERLNSQLRAGVMDSVSSAHQKIKALGIGAGTTISIAAITQSAVQFFNVGDSLTLLSGGLGLHKFKNVEHSPLGYGIEAGYMNESEILGHPSVGVVLNALGIEPFRMEVSQEIELAKRDYIVIASDGLTDNMVYSKISEEIRRGSSLEKMEKLVKESSERMSTSLGKPDDLSIILLQLT